jgi:hypothetical protein
MSKVPDPLPVGYKIGRYIVEAELAPGRMGRVYRASCPIQGKSVAINICAAERNSHEEAIFLDRVRRVCAKYHEKVGDDLAKFPILDLFMVEGLTGVVVMYEENVGAVLDVGAE